MKRLCIVLGLGIGMLGLNHEVQAQRKGGLGDWLKKAEDQIGGKSGKGQDFTNKEAVSALKEALEIGSRKATERLSQPNGFFGNTLIKILLPPEARQVEATLRRVGMGKYVDEAILAMNRAAEDASSKAVPLFVEAIKGMSVTDGISIVKGGDGAATRYLESRTSAQLSREFRPVIDQSLSRVRATQYWRELFEVYNRLPTTRTPVNPDLSAHVTEKALEGLFKTIAQEENKIRQDPAAQVSGLLKKVFGQP